jgi:prevent-host-death family protein
MPPIRAARDIRPLSEFRAQSAAFIEHIRTTRKPMILTQHGRSAAVLLDIDAYEELMHEMEFLRDVRTSEEEVAAHQGIDHETVATRLRSRLGR